jgi:hypothetical protein
MARKFKIREIAKDDELGVMRKEVTLPNNFGFVTPITSIRDIIDKSRYFGVNEITKQIDEGLIKFVEERGTTSFVSSIRTRFAPNKFNLTIFDLISDIIPDKGSLSTLAQCLYGASDSAIMLPTVKMSLLKDEEGKLSEKKVHDYIEMMRFIIDEIEQVGNGKIFIGTIPLIPPKFSRPIINLYQDKDIEAFAIDIGTKDALLNEVDYRLILSEIKKTIPLAETLVYACNLGFPQFERIEIRADDFLSLFAYVDIFGTTFKRRGGKTMRGRLPRAKIFTSERYAYTVTSYEDASRRLGIAANYATLKEYNKIGHLQEADKVSTMIGIEKMKTYLQRKPAVDSASIARLERIAKA